VVLAEREDVETDLLGVLGDRDDILDPLRLGRRRPVVGSVVMSLTEKIPNCMTRSLSRGAE